MAGVQRSNFPRAGGHRERLCSGQSLRAVVCASPGAALRRSRQNGAILVKAAGLDSLSPHTDAAAALAGCTAAPSQRAHKTIAAGRNVNAISRRQSQARAVAKGSLHLAVGSTVLDLLVVVLFLPPLAAAPLPLMVPILTQSACILLLWCNARRLRA